jgi:hypothetical protein
MVTRNHAPNRPDFTDQAVVNPLRKNKPNRMNRVAAQKPFQTARSEIVAAELLLTFNR